MPCCLPQGRQAAKCAARYLGASTACATALDKQAAMYAAADTAGLIRWQFLPFCLAENAPCQLSSGLPCCNPDDEATLKVRRRPQHGGAACLGGAARPEMGCTYSTGSLTRRLPPPCLHYLRAQCTKALDGALKCISPPRPPTNPWGTSAITPTKAANGAVVVNLNLTAATDPAGLRERGRGLGRGHEGGEGTVEPVWLRRCQPAVAHLPFPHRELLCSHHLQRQAHRAWSGGGLLHHHQQQGLRGRIAPVWCLHPSLVGTLRVHPPRPCSPPACSPPNPPPHLPAREQTAITIREGVGSVPVEGLCGRSFDFELTYVTEAGPSLPIEYPANPVAMPACPPK